MRTILTWLCSGLLLPGYLSAAEVNAALLVFRVTEAGAEPYISRILVTPGQLRMDEGTEGVAYTLYDRKVAVLYNVDDEARSVLVVNPTRNKPESPILLDIAEVERPAASESVDGIAPISWQLTANGETCVAVEALPGVMGETMVALADLYDLLGYAHGALVQQTPPQYLDACDLAQNIYAPRGAWSQGLPLHMRSERIALELLDHEAAFAVDENLFKVPPEYRSRAMPISGGQ